MTLLKKGGIFDTFVSKIGPNLFSSCVFPFATTFKP